MIVKDKTVNIVDLQHEMKDKLQGIDHIFMKYGVEAVITSGKDSVHGDNSKHYLGLAIDLRTYHVLDRIVQDLKNHLGKDYDVVLEKDHIHVEYDPKS